MTKTTDWTTEYLQLIEDCEDREQRLSDWDRTFLDSIKAQVGRGVHLTQNQDDKLSEVWERATAKG